MHMTRAFGFSVFALAIGLAAAPRAQAQSFVQTVVCRDGQVTSTWYGARACDRHGGIDNTATIRARQGTVVGTNGQRGIYSGGGVNNNAGNREIYGGNNNGTNRQVYGVIYNSNNPVVNGQHDNGKHNGWKKHHKHHKGNGDNDHDRDDDR
jgi:hypothetical protein